MKIYWHKLNEKAIIPSKRIEDAGFDIYTTDDHILLMPFEKRLFSTGLAAAAQEGWWLLAMDRGSTGSRGIHTHCGIIDNGYRGEIFICLCNDNEYPVMFTSDEIMPHIDEQAFYLDPDSNLKRGKILYYPVSKAIAQIVPIPQPFAESIEADDDTWASIPKTLRGDGKLGDSGK